MGKKRNNKLRKDREVWVTDSMSNEEVWNEHIKKKEKRKKERNKWK